METKNWFSVKVALLLICMAVGHIDAQWYPQESGTKYNLYGVCFVDSLNGWACGDSGIILHTSDGGNTWLTQTSGTSEPLEDVFFWDTSTGWAVGGRGVIVHTDDGGKSWSIQPTPVSEHLYVVQFASLDNGWVGGAHLTLLGTTDAGTVWTGSSGDSTTGNVYALFRIDIGRGAFTYTGIGTMFFTLDEGAIWEPFSSDIFPYAFFDLWGYLNATLPSFTRDFYWMVGEEGHAMWVIVEEYKPPPRAYGLIGSTPDTLDLYGVTLDLPSWKLWAVGQKGWIISSTDTGKTWQSDSSGTEMDLYEVSFPDSAQGWVVGESGTILHYHGHSGIKDRDWRWSSPRSFQLLEPYPNPFNRGTEIQYVVAKPEWMELKIYDLRGSLIKTLLRGKQTSGFHRINWDGCDKAGREVSSGIYFCCLTASDFTATKKLVVLK